MAPHQTTFSLPGYRGNQLRRIAQTKNMPVGELVISWIDRELQESGVAVHQRPFAGVVRSDDVEFSVEATFLGQEKRSLSLEQAGGIHDALIRTLNEGGAQAYGYTDRQNVEHMVSIARAGAGLRLKLDDIKLTMSLTAGREIAQGLEVCCQDLRARSTAGPEKDRASVEGGSSAPSITEQNPNYGLFR